MVEDFPRNRFVAFDPIGVGAGGRVQVVGAGEGALFAAQLGHVRPAAQAVFERGEAGAETLHGLALQRRAVAGDGDLGLQAGGGAVGGQGNARVAAGRGRHARGAGQPGARHELGRHAVLVTAGGIGALAFQPQPAHAFRLGQGSRLQAGRVAFAQRDRMQHRQRHHARCRWRVDALQRGRMAGFQTRRAAFGIVARETDVARRMQRRPDKAGFISMGQYSEERESRATPAPPAAGSRRHRCGRWRAGTAPCPLAG